jgi:hypothetical protein
MCHGVSLDGVVLMHILAWPDRVISARLYGPFSAVPRRNAPHGFYLEIHSGQQ